MTTLLSYTHMSIKIS